MMHQPIRLDPQPGMSTLLSRRSTLEPPLASHVHGNPSPLFPPLVEIASHYVCSRGENLYIVKSNFKLLQNKKKLYKYFKEYSIGLSIRSPYVIRYIDFKRYAPHYLCMFFYAFIFCFCIFYILFNLSL